MYRSRFICMGIVAVFMCTTSCNRNEELSMQPSEGYPWLESIEEIQELLAAKCVDTIAFQAGEVVADIGAGNGYLEAMLAMFHDSLNFYVQDIDASVCNQQVVDSVVNFYQEVKGTPITSTFTVINGSDSLSCLPEIEFDRVLMLWSYQYIKYPKKFVSDIRTRLKPSGLLYVINPEQDYAYGLELREEYGWNCSTVEQQIMDIMDCGFTLLNFARNYEDNQQPYIMLFKKSLF